VYIPAVTDPEILKIHDITDIQNVHLYIQCTPDEDLYTMHPFI